jgi:hypothetical protein
MAGLVPAISFALMRMEYSLSGTRAQRARAVPGFSNRYDVRRLVWFECYDDPTNAIARERTSKDGVVRGRAD